MYSYLFPGYLVLYIEDQRHFNVQLLELINWLQQYGKPIKNEQMNW
jgi:hypothetical protein